MRQVRRFRDLDAAMSHRLLRLELLARQCSAIPSRQRLREAGYLALELHNCWAGFARAHFLSTVFGVQTLSGRIASARPPATCSTPSDAIALARKFVGARREPAWFDNQVYARIASHFNFSNLPSVTQAFSYQTSFFTLSTVRNYFAHKNEETFIKLHRIGSAIAPSPRHRPDEVFVGVLRASSPPLVIEWIHDAMVMKHLMLQ
jgi:hypothetical protein